MAKWNNDVLRVAVTGAGGGCGQAIIAALKQSGLPVEIYPVDVTPFAAGLYLGYGGTVLPRPEQDIDAWRRWAVNMRLHAIIPGSDHDLAPFSAVREQWQNDWQIKLLVNNPFVVEVSNDKLRTVQELGACGIDVPMSYAGEALPDWMNYLDKRIVKPRFGMASRGVQVVSTPEECQFHWSHTDSPVMQECIEGDEYTCALFFDSTSCLRATFVMKRWLRSGDTQRAAAGDYPEVVQYLQQFAEKTRERFQWQGAVNLQLRLHPERGCIPFEINARCSGSTAIWAAFGYNEPEMLLRHFVRDEYIEQPQTRHGFAMRYSEFVCLPVSESDIATMTKGSRGRRIEL